MGVKKLKYLMRILFENISHPNKKSESGQAQILIIFTFLFLLFSGVIIAQNATNITNSSLTLEGNMIVLNESDFLNNSLSEHLSNISDEMQNQETATPENNKLPFLSVDIHSPDKITRGEEFIIKAVVKNSGDADAKNVVLEWVLPEGFEIVSGNAQENCEIPPSSECTSEIIVKASFSSILGKNDIKVLVRYVD